MKYFTIVVCFMFEASLLLKHFNKLYLCRLMLKNPYFSDSDSDLTLRNTQKRLKFFSQLHFLYLYTTKKEKEFLKHLCEKLCMYICTVFSILGVPRSKHNVDNVVVSNKEGGD